MGIGLYLVLVGVVGLVILNEKAKRANNDSNCAHCKCNDDNHS